MSRIPPDTETFLYHNQNPHNRKTADSVIRAISAATNIPYNRVLLELASMQVKTGFDMSDKTCYGRYLKELGWEKQNQPKKDDGTKYTGKEFCKALYRGEIELKNDYRIIAHIGGHHIVAIIDYQVWDIWNSTGGCIGNFWVKA